ncbi:unnamed protein product [Aphanomyces euteiches]
MTDRATMLKHASMHKGLTNQIGQNNCFLNVIIQSLWHLDSFRVLIRSSDHTTFHRVQDTCLLCELKEIFTYYEYSDEKALAPDNVRLALNVLSAQTDRFRLGAMADATETLDTIFASMHADQCRHAAAVVDHLSPLDSSMEIKEMDCDPKCIAHALFESNMFDMYHCSTCNATSEPDMWKDTLYRVYFAELYTLVSSSPSSVSASSSSSFFFGGNSPLSPPKKHSFEAVLKKLVNEGPRKSCPEADLTKCTGKCTVERWLMKFPIVFAVSIVWPSNSIGGKELKAFANIIPHELDLSRVFRLGGDAAGQPTNESIYVFRGMVCYYGQHYVSFFKSQSKPNHWYLFDDVHVHAVGPWDEVRRRIERGCYQPTLLFWEKNQLVYEQLETLAMKVHQQPSTPRRRPTPAPSSSPPPPRPTPPSPSQAPPPTIQVSLPMDRPRRALDILYEEVEERPRSPSVPPPPSPWRVLLAPVAASVSGRCRYTVRLTAQDGGLGLIVSPDKASPGHLIVERFESTAAGDPLPAQACQVIQPGDQLIQIDSDVVDDSWTQYTAMERLVTAAVPNVHSSTPLTL